MYRKKWTTKHRLIRNLCLVFLGLLLIWIAAGMPAFTAKGAFRRAMRENMTSDVKPSVIIGQNDIRDNVVTVVLGEKDGIWYQAAVRKKWDVFWEHYEIVSETEDRGEFCIVSLLTNTYLMHSNVTIIRDRLVPIVALRAAGETANLWVTVGDQERPLVGGLAKQDGWFVFSYEEWYTDNQLSEDYFNFIRIYPGYLDTPIRMDHPHGSFRFRTYDADGNVLQEGIREF